MGQTEVRGHVCDSHWGRIGFHSVTHWTSYDQFFTLLVSTIAGEGQESHCAHLSLLHRTKSCNRTTCTSHLCFRLMLWMWSQRGLILQLLWYIRPCARTRWVQPCPAAYATALCTSSLTLDDIKSIHQTCSIWARFPPSLDEKAFELNLPRQIKHELADSSGSRASLRQRSWNILEVQGNPSTDRSAVVSNASAGLALKPNLIVKWSFDPRTRKNDQDGWDVASFSSIWPLLLGAK